MRIAHQSSLAVVLCAVGGLVVAGTVMGASWRMDRVVRELGPNSVAMRDLDHLRPLVSQLFVTADLVMARRETYLAEGLSRQVEGIDKLLESLGGSSLVGTDGRVTRISRCLVRIESAVERSARLVGEAEANLSALVAELDEASTTIIDELAKLHDAMEERSEAAVVLAGKRERQMVVGGTVAGGLYLVTIGAVAYWLSMTVVTPVRRLSDAARRAEATGDRLEATPRGPREIRELTRTLGSFVANLRAESERVELAQERYRLAVLGSQNGLWDWNLSTNKVYYAPQWMELLGLREDQVGDSPDEWFGRIVSGDLSAFHADLIEHLEGESDRFDTEIKMVHADGHPRWMLCRAVAVRDEAGVATRVAGSLADINDQKLAQEELRRLAQHDRLTGLPNRELFSDHVRRAISRTKRDERRHFVVLFFDFDRFKLINDSLGHNVGDALLVSIAERFRAMLRETDTAARFGGDEFVVLLNDVHETGDAEHWCERFLEAFRKPHDLDGHEVVSTASIGLTSSEFGYDDADEMIRDADAAMYQAKLAGKARYCVFSEEMHAQVLERMHLEHDLQRADLDEQFHLVYQPIVSLSTGEIAGFEALIRWRHPEQGVIGPDMFISIAEETGHIVPMGEWILRTVCAQFERLRSIHGGDLPLHMNVNLSKRQLVHPALLNTLRDILRDFAMDPSDIFLEITETAVMDERHDMTVIMGQIRDLGFRLAMDDFGTGHSSLSCLHRFPIDVLKVDRSFIRNMENRREFTAVMHAIVTLAHHLDLTVVAEGVETRGQLAQLQSMNCEFAQGFLFGQPMSGEQTTALLRQGRRIQDAA